MARFSIAAIVEAARLLQDRGEPITRQAIADELGAGTEAVDTSITNARQAGRLEIVPGRGARTRYRLPSD